MTVQELLDEEYNNKVTDFEIYEARGRRHTFHSDFIEAVDDNKEARSREVIDWQIMDEEDYDTSILANSSEKANFAEWYGDKNAKVLCILIGEETSIQKIAELLNANVVETTSESNGYPSNIISAITNFSDEIPFDRIEDIASKYGYNIEYINQKDGWQLWHRSGGVGKPLDLYSEYLKNHTVFIKKAIYSFYDEEVRPDLEDFDDFDDLEKFIESKYKMYNDLKSMNDNEMMVLYDGYYEIMPQKSYGDSEDNEHIQLALIKY